MEKKSKPPQIVRLAWTVYKLNRYARIDGVKALQEIVKKHEASRNTDHSA